MIQNIAKGRGFRGALNYTLEKDGAELIGGNMAGRTPRELAAEFRAVRELRPDVEKAVFHASLSAPVGERLTEAQWVALADRYAQQMGFGESAYVVIRHGDRAHDHVHVIASRVDAMGRVVSDQWDRYKGQEVLRILEKEHGLSVVRSSWESPGKQRTQYEVQQDRESIVRHEQPFRELVKEHAGSAFERANSWSELEQRLGEYGLRVEPKRGGLVVTDGVESVKASSVEREYSRAKLEQRFGVTYDDWQEQRTHQREPQRAPDRDPSRDRRSPARGPDGVVAGRLDAGAERSAEPDRYRATARAIRADLERAEWRAGAETARAVASARAVQAERELTAVTSEHWSRARVAEMAFTRSLETVYRDPQAARQAIETAAKRTGWSETLQGLRAAPERFGELQGHRLGRLGFDAGARERAVAAVPELARTAANHFAAQGAVRQGEHQVSELTRTRDTARVDAQTLGERLRGMPSQSELLKRAGHLAHELGRLAPAELQRLEQALTQPHRALLGKAKALAKEAVLGHEPDRGMER